MTIAIVVVLIVLIVILIIYNKSLQSRIQAYVNINQRIKSLNVVQDFMNTIGEYSSVDDKIKKINEILIEQYEIKYSTIVVFDGADYQIKASNVDKKHWDALKRLQDVEIFKDSISTATPKYVSVNNEREKLPYQQMEFGRAKSAVFFPLYIDNVYIGYWIIESSIPHDFEKIDTTIFEVVKDNIISVLKTVVHQRTLEAIVRKDLFTGLYSEEYLYGEGKRLIDSYTLSTACMFKIVNLEQINNKYSRELGNKVITEISRYIKDNIADEYIFIRYMGPKFVIMFCGADVNGVEEFIKDIKLSVEKLEISLYDEEQENVENEVKKKKIKKVNPIVNPKLNFVMTSYYKGTGLEEVLKELENYLDNAEKSESNIISI